MAAARDYDYLRIVLGELKPATARKLRLIISEDEDFAEADQKAREALGDNDDEAEDEVPPGLLALFGSIEAPADYGENHDHYIRERMERRLDGAE